MTSERTSWGRKRVELTATGAGASVQAPVQSGNLSNEGSCSSSKDVQLQNLPRPEAAGKNACRPCEERAAFPPPADAQAKAKQRLHTKQQKKLAKHCNDELYSECISVTSVPLSVFLRDEPQQFPLVITSISEDKLLKALGVPQIERNNIQGLPLPSSSSTIVVRSGAILSEAQVAAQTIVRLAHDPPTRVFRMQRRTCAWLLRSFPLGFRFSGKNMSPIPGWMSGCQSVALNMSNVDVSLHLHFALFKGSRGFVLKPTEMRAGQQPTQPPLTELSDSAPPPSLLAAAEYESCGSCDSLGKLMLLGASSVSLFPDTGAMPRRMTNPTRGTTTDADKEGRGSSCINKGHGAPGSNESGEPMEPIKTFWPPPREALHRASLRLVSLHNLPKRGERRPAYDGSCGACHAYAPELSGTPAPPENSATSVPALALSLHPIGGFCAVSDTLPLPENVKTEFTTRAVDNGMNATFDDTVHCVAAEPNAAFLRFGVMDGRKEVAFGSVVLGRLRGGYRTLPLRGVLGTRIECCYLFVHISFGSLPNKWATPSQLKVASHEHRKKSFVAAQELAVLRQQLAELKHRHGPRGTSTEHCGMRPLDE